MTMIYLELLLVTIPVPPLGAQREDSTLFRLGEASYDSIAVKVLKGAHPGLIHWRRQGETQWKNMSTIGDKSHEISNLQPDTAYEVCMTLFHNGTDTDWSLRNELQEQCLLSTTQPAVRLSSIIALVAVLAYPACSALIGTTTYLLARHKHHKRRQSRIAERKKAEEVITESARAENQKCTRPLDYNNLGVEHDKPRVTAATSTTTVNSHESLETAFSETADENETMTEHDHDSRHDRGRTPQVRVEHVDVHRTKTMQTEL